MSIGTRRLPLGIALTAFVLYASMMGGGVMLDSLPWTAKLAGWDNSLWTGQPVLWLVTLPLRVLPAAWVPLAVKLLAAAMGAAILGILARTVQLLPWDHAWDLASRSAATLPVLTACGLCGLEFSFWKEATSNVNELLDLLLLAGLVWLWLEHELRDKAIWLDAVAVVLGLGMAQNWVLLPALPVLAFYALWARRKRIARGLARGEKIQWARVVRFMILWLAGFLAYALAATANGLKPHAPWTFGGAWLANLQTTRNLCKMLYYGFWKSHRLLTMVVALYFLAPVLPLVVRLRDEGTGNKSGVDQFQIWIYRSLRLGLLLGCCWVVFDPTTGLRQLVQHQMGLHLPLLTFDYVVALGAGFLTGNLLLISQPVAARDGLRRSRGGFPWKRLAVPVAAGGVALLSAGLIARNAPAVWNEASLDTYGRLAVESLPPGPGVMLSDFPERLYAFEAALAHSPHAGDWLAVSTHELGKVAYRERLEKKLPAGWLTESNRHVLTPVEEVRLLAQVAGTNRLYYLHPSFGYYFESFYLQPTGAIYEMKLRGKDLLDAPALPQEVIRANEEFWTNAWDRDMARLAPKPGHQGRLAAKMAQYGLTPASHGENLLLAEWFSISLDGWGVALQRAGDIHGAYARLTEALQLNTNNFSARITLACNTNVQAGLRMGVADAPKLAGFFGGPERLAQLTDNCGPFDEPTICYLQGSSFVSQGLLVQSAEEFERVRALAPGSLPPEIALAEIYNRLGMADRSRPIIEHLRQETQTLPANSTLDLSMALLESYSSLLQTNVAGARNALASVVAEHPDDPQIADRVLSAYMALGDYTNALRLVDGRLEKNPNEIASLVKKGAILVTTGKAMEAVNIFDRALEVTNDPMVRLNRALAYIAGSQTGPAQADLRELETEGYNPPVVDYGFALAAQTSHDTNGAVHYLQLCLSNAPAGSALWLQAGARLQSLSPLSGGR